MTRVSGATAALSEDGLRFTVLGGTVGAERDGVPVAIGGPRQRTLLAALLAEHGRVVSADRLVELIWPEDAGPVGARKTVLSYVSRLRSAIGATHLVTRDAGYLLALDGATYDAADFELALAEARARDGDAALDAYDRALALWTGRAFGAQADEWWLRPVAVRLEELRLVACEEATALLIDLGRHGRAVADLDRLVAEHPLRERFAELRMCALHQSGRQAEALREFCRFRDHLAEETGLDPSDDLIELEGRIVRGDPDHAPASGTDGPDDVLPVAADGHATSAHQGGRMCLLGAVRIEGQGGEAHLAGSQPRLVLVRLALEPGQPVAAEDLASDLWPHGGTQHWEGAVRGIVAKVRSFLLLLEGVGVVVENVGHGYQLSCPDPTVIDVHAAEALGARARGALDAGEADAAASDAAAAAELLDHPLLPGVDTEWSQVWRARLGERSRHALALASAAASTTGDHGTAVELAARAVALDGFDEEAHRALMAAHLAAENRAEGLQAYSRCRRLLAADLGISPSEETEALYLALLGEGGVHPAPGRPGRHSLPTTADRPFVGRAALLDDIAAAWSAARAGRPQVVLIHGETGVGKTRVVLEAVRRAAPDRVLYGRSSAEHVVAFEPVAEGLSRHLAQLDETERATVVQGLESPLAALVHMPDRPAEGRADPSSPTTGGRAHLFDAVASLVGRLAAQPTVLVLDDLHWADPATLLLVRHLLHRVDGARLLVLATYRDDVEVGAALADAVDDLVRSETCRSRHLPGLDRAEVEALLDANGVRHAAAVARVLAERTGGNGFYLTQVLGASAGVVDPFAIPDSVRELVRHRTAALSPAARDALGLAAALGTTVPGPILEAALLPSGVDGLEQLLDHHLLLETDTGGYGFSHALVRDVAYEQLSPMRRRQVHGRVATAIEQQHGDAPEWAASLSLHLLRADDPARASLLVDATLRAADVALDGLAYEQAIELYDRAAAVIERRGIEDGRLDRCLWGQGAARRRAGDLAGAADPLRRALARARVGGRGERFAEAVLELVARGGRGAAPEMEDDDRASLLQEAVDLLDGSDPGLEVALLAELALSLVVTDQHTQVAQVAGQAERAARASGRLDLAVHAVVAQRLLAPLPDGAQERLAHTADLLVRARSEIDPEQAVRLHMWRVTDTFEIGDRDGVDRELADLLRASADLGQPYWSWVATTWGALVSFLDGDEDGAEATAAAALADVERIGNPETLTAYGVQHMCFRALQGRAGEMVPLARQAVDQMPALTAMRCGLAMALAHGGHHDEARSLLHDLAADDLVAIPRNGSWAISTACLVETACEVRDIAVARRLIPLVEPYRERFVVVSGFGGGGACLGPFSGLLASLRATVGETDGAAAEFAEAMAAADRFRSPVLRRWIASQRDRRLERAAGTVRAQPIGG